ncbi:hypothetical protein T439DRAFT_199126 [Meredithblackwellia eburnea MCA 4105]
MVGSASIIRDAELSEDIEIAFLFHNSFRFTWNHNWFAGAKTIPEPISKDQLPSLTKDQSSRMLFYSALITSVRLSGGIVRVLADSDGSNIVGAALWTRPGHPLTSAPLDYFRSGFLTLIWRWGWRGLRTIAFEFEGTVEKLFSGAFKKRKEDGRTDEFFASSGYLHMIAVEPSRQGKGLGMRLVKDGLKIMGDKSLVLLDTTEEGPKRLYERAGFQLVGEAKVGVGRCDEKGLMNGDLKIGGGPLFVMLRERSSLI